MNPIHPTAFVDRVISLMLGATAVLVVVAGAGMVRQCHRPNPAIITAAQHQDAQVDTVFITDTLRLAAATRGARESTDGLLSKPPAPLRLEPDTVDEDSPYARTEDNVDGGMAATGPAICFPLYAFNAWRDSLRTAILDERKMVQQEITRRNARIGELTQQLQDRTDAWNRALRRPDPRLTLAIVQLVSPEFRTVATATWRMTRIGPVNFNVGLGAR